jgi:hypothetical protein
VWANALKVDGLTAEQRQQVLTYLPADELAHCLLRLHDGELRWALTRHPARAKLATLVAGQGLPLAKQAWMADIVELLPLAWPTSLRQPPVAVATRMYLTRRFGDDISRWETALSLLTGWEDTLTRLADTVDLLTTQ